MVKGCSCCVLLALLGLAHPKPAPQPALVLFERAFSLWRQGSLEQADARFDELLGTHAAELEAHGSLASALLNSGNIKQARGDLDGAKQAWGRALNATDLKPTVQCMLLLSLGSAHLEDGMVREGIAQFNQAHREGCDPQLQETMAARINGALEYAESKMRGAASPNFEVIWRAGLLASVTGKSQRALELLSAAAALRPDHTDTALLRETASVYSVSKQHKQAEKQLKRCVHIDPTHAESWQLLGSVRSELGDDSGAREAYEEAYSVDPTHRSLIALGRLLERAGEREEAMARYEAAEVRGVLQSKWQRPGELSPGLSARAFHEVSEWRVVKRLQSSWRELQAEVLEVLESGELRRESVADTEGLTANSEDWMELNVYFKGKRFEKNLRLLPLLDRLITEIPELTSQVKGATKVSVIGPGDVTVRPHCGPSNTRLRLHLPLLVPDNSTGWLRVGAESRAWREGLCLGFDDSFEHQVRYSHPSSPRVVLIADVWHPDMNESSRVASLTEQAEVDVYNYHKARFMQIGKWFNSTAFP